MNSQGDILAAEKVLALSKAEQADFIPISDKDIGIVAKMGRASRRAWYELNKSKSDPHQGMQEKLRRLKQLERQNK